MKLYFCNDCKKEIHTHDPEQYGWNIIHLGHGCHDWVCEKCDTRRELIAELESMRFDYFEFIEKKVSK